MCGDATCSAASSTSTSSPLRRDDRVSVPHAGKPTVIRISSDQAMRSGRVVFEEWRRALQAGARAAPRQRFNNLPPSELKGRLAVLARAHDFSVVRVSFLRPVRLAPIVIVRTKYYV